MKTAECSAVCVDILASSPIGGAFLVKVVCVPVDFAAGCVSPEGTERAIAYSAVCVGEVRKLTSVRGDFLVEVT